jgi:hypothetical protein
LTPGEVRPFGIRFTADGDDKDIRTATFTVQSPDVPSVQIAASGVAYTARVPRPAVNASLHFGEIPRGAHQLLSFTMANTVSPISRSRLFLLPAAAIFSWLFPYCL